MAAFDLTWLGNAPRLLVVMPNRIGDVLLTTPLLRSLKQHWPLSRIDMAVFAGTEGIVAGNPDLERIIVMPKRGGWRAAVKHWRRYDLAFAARANDRAFWWARLAGRQCVALRPAALVAKSAHPSRMTGLKRLADLPESLATVNVPLDEHRARIDAVLTLATAIGIAPVAQVVPPVADEPARRALEALLGSAPEKLAYAVLHPQPMFQYKAWHVAGWRGLIEALQQRGLAVCISGGGAPAETAALDALLANLTVPVLRFDGRLSFAQLADLLRHARVYVGPDTVTTHLAAACGTPMLALFGPTDPVRWGPRPASRGQDGFLSPYVPYVSHAPVQRRGSVRLLQHDRLPCVPCHQEGCDRHPASNSLCLQLLPLASVIAELDALLTMPHASPALCDFV